MPARSLTCSKKMDYKKPTEVNRPEHYSGIQSFFSCPMKYYYSYVHNGHGIVSIDHVPAMAFGTAIHFGLASYAQHRSYDSVAGKIIKDTEILFNGMMYPCRDDVAAKIFGLKANIRAALITSFNNFFIDYLDTYAEVPFYVPEYNFYGTVDRIDKGIKRILWEYKTSSSLSINTVKSLVNSIQQPIYVLCLNKIGFPVDCVNTAIIKKSTLRTRVKEEMEELTLRIAAEYISKPSEYIFKSEWDVDKKLLVDTEIELRAALDIIRSTSVYYRNTSNCFSMMGNRCRYYMICRDDITLGYKDKEPLNLGKHKEERPWL